MSDELYKKMSTIRNIELAWMRIKTGQNIQYKKYYRDLFLAYELTKQENIKRLSERLRGGSYHPSNILRFYQPKSSGLQRPITFLYLDDLIVYQSQANIIAEKFEKVRGEIEFKNVFSNVLNREEDTQIFFLKKWQEGYGKFIKKIKNYYEDGNVWVAHFDLSAHYDTIDHDSLADQISKNAYKDFTKLLTECLWKWSSQKTNKLKHGIPQGPIASNFLSEIHMLPIDNKLNKEDIKYVRYGDDIKIFGCSKSDVLEGVILLDEECKEHGLIPQSKKYEIIEAQRVEDAIGKFPSLTSEEKLAIFVNPEESHQIFLNAFNEKNFDISKVKYILKVSDKNDKILNIIMEKLNHHPEIVDEFFQFLFNYTDNPEIGRNIYLSYLEKPSPYEYVEGKYWELLSYFSFDDNEKSIMINKAIIRLKQSKNKYALRRGIYIFICSMRKCLILKWLNKESSSLIQMMIVPYISMDCVNQKDYKELLHTFLKRSNYEPAIAAIKELIYNLEFILLRTLPLSNKDESGVINNLLGKPEEIDSIGQIIKRRYEIEYYNKWKKFLEADYQHANYIILCADNAYYIDTNVWIAYTDSFNEILIRRFISLLQSIYPREKWPPLKDNKTNKNIDYGVLLDRQNQLSKHYLKIMDGFRLLHIRRSKIPVTHAYEKKTARSTSIVTRKERKELYEKLKVSYRELINVLRFII